MTVTMEGKDFEELPCNRSEIDLFVAGRQEGDVETEQVTFMLPSLRCL